MSTQSAEASACANKAVQRLKQGQLHEAEQLLKQALTLQPDNAQWLLELARLQRRYDPDQALGAFEAARQLGSVDAELEAAALYAKPGVIEYLSPAVIWQSDRLDIGAKLLFARNYLSQKQDTTTEAMAFYDRHILLRTGGKEPGSLRKTSLEDYQQSFITLIESIRLNGFKEEFAIPVDNDERILNGAHRLAAALALRLEKIPVVRMPPAWKGWEWGMAWFLNQGFTPAEINLLLQLWVEAHGNQVGLLIIEHSGNGVPPVVMSELAQQFSLLAWRELNPISSPLSLPENFLCLPKGPWRYVLVNTKGQDLQTFAIRQNKKHTGSLHCSAISGASCQALLDCLLNESIVASWHPDCVRPTDNSSSMAMWTRYASA